MDNLGLLLAIGLTAGAMNAAAGGGSFLTLPALIYAGVPPIAANASSTVALFPGSLASAWALREHIRSFPGVSMGTLILLTLLGGGAGAFLLLMTPPSNFVALVPWLLLIGSLAFAFGAQVGRWLRRKMRIGPLLVLVGQFLLGIYGGYFGGAVGIMMMAVWAVFGVSDIQRLNANKTLFVGLANVTAVAVFIVAGKVYWPQTSVLMMAGVIGGHFSALCVKKLDPRKLRTAIVIVNFLITGGFFLQTFG